MAVGSFWPGNFSVRSTLDPMATPSFSMFVPLVCLGVCMTDPVPRDWAAGQPEVFAESMTLNEPTEASEPAMGLPRSQSPGSAANDESPGCSATSEEIAGWVKTLVGEDDDDDQESEGAAGEDDGASPKDLALAALRELDAESAERLVREHGATFRALSEDYLGRRRASLDEHKELYRERAEKFFDHDREREEFIQGMQAAFRDVIADESATPEEYRAGIATAYPVIRDATLLRRVKIARMIDPDRTGFLSLAGDQLRLEDLDGVFDHARRTMEADPRYARLIKRLRIPDPWFPEYLALDVRDRLEPIALSTRSSAGAKVMRRNASRMEDLSVPAIEMLFELFQHRVVAGVAPLSVDERLCNLARLHAEDMATHGFVGHDSPVPGRATLEDRAAELKTRAEAECIVHLGVESEDDLSFLAFQDLWQNRNEARILIGDWRRVGSAHVDGHWVLVFQK